MTYILNLIGLAGFAALLSGVYLKFGLSATLMFGGAMLLIFALLALRKLGGCHA